MRLPGDNLEELLGNVLRGVSKIVGCNSTNLVVINDAKREMRVRIGTTADAYPILAELEEMLGVSFQGLTVPIEAAEGGLIARVWRDGAMRETSSLAEMVGGAIPAELVTLFSEKAGERRFLVAPAVGTHRRYGVLLFEKPGLSPFSRQQREVLLRFARRIGAILENELVGQEISLGPTRADQASCVLLSAAGRICGQGLEINGAAELIQSALGEQVRAWLGEAGGEPPRGVLPDGRRITCQRFDLGTEPAALCWLSDPAPAGGDSLENQLLQLTMAQPAPALFTDPDFQITSTNPAAAKLFNTTPEALVGVGLDALFCEPDEIGEVLARQVVSPGGPATELNTIARLPDGGLLPARVEALLLADDRDRAVGHLILLRSADNAGQVLTQAQLVEQERLATMGEMAAQLAHEIRNPLLAIGATLEGLGREPDQARQRKLIAAATNEINRLDMVLRKHLSPRGELEFDQIRLADLAADVQRLLEGARRRQDKIIRNQVPAGLTARADYEAMRHVLFNLLLNALEASPPGGEVTIRAQANGAAVSLVIEDQGPGLGATAQQCMQPFFTTKSSGTGLGLAVCAKLVGAHAGVLELSDREAGGCAARVVLPNQG